MNVLITGVAGFMGSHLADALISKGHNVYGIDNLIGGYEENVPNKVTFYNVDLDNLELIQPMFESFSNFIYRILVGVLFT